MKKILHLLLLLAVATTSAAIDKKQLLFVKNQNQWDHEILYRADLPGGAVFLTGSGFVYNYYKSKDLERIHELKHKQASVGKELVNFHAYSVSFKGCNTLARIEATEKQSFYHNYFLGNDPKKWASNVPVFHTIKYHQIYKGVDATIYSHGSNMKYDFIVGPGADAGAIQLLFNGVKPALTKNGDLQIKTSVATIIEKAPYCYQIINGKTQEVACKYRIEEDGTLRFSFPQGYDRTKELIIDPVLVFATFSGSTASTWGFSATYDASGCLFAGGEVFSPGWPVITGAFQAAFGGIADAGINKYSSNGSTLIYSTYYGGSGSDLPNNMIVNSKDQLVVTGSTNSSDLPVTNGCYDNSFNGGMADLYVARFNASGTALLGATYIGGTNNDGELSVLSTNYGDQHRGDLFINTSGHIIVCASSASQDFPTTGSAFQPIFGGGNQDGVVFLLDSTCSNLIFSSFLGGSLNDACFALAKAANDDIIVVGGTESTNFPTTPGVLHSTYQGAIDGFVSVISPNGNTLVHSSYLGTISYDHAFKVQVNPLNNNIYVCGQNSGNYPVSPGVYSNSSGNIFIQELTGDLSTALLSTTIGDPLSTLIPTAFLYDVCGNIYFCGFGAGIGLPLTPNAHQSAQGGFWLSVLNPGMNSLLYATYLGGTGDHVDGGSSRFDPLGIVYHSVCTNSGFTTTPGCWAPNNLAGSFDVASFKFNFEAVGAVAVSGIQGNDSVCIPATIQFTNNSVSANSYSWDFGDGSPISSAVAPSHTYTTPGTYTVALYAHALVGCSTDDTAYLTVQAFQLDKPVLSVQDTTVCKTGIIDLTANVSGSTHSRSFHWAPANAIVSNADQQTVTVDTRLSDTFTITVTDSIEGLCKESASGTIHLTLRDADEFKAFGDTSICRGDTALLWTAGGNFYAWTPDYYISDTTSSSVRVAPQENIIYTVLISDSLGCKKIRDVTVKLNPDADVNASEDIYIKYGESTIISATGAAIYHWSPHYRIETINIAAPTVNPEVTTTYYVVGTTQEGCIGMDSVTVNVTNVIIPSVFSPNGDGRNDKFRVKPSHDGVRVIDLSVYNRWGERVFKTNQISEGWDGSYKGKPADIDTYFYLTTYEIGKKRYTIKGDITLVR